VRRRWARAFLQAAVCALLLGGAGCRKEMWVQPKYDPLDMSEFYSDTMSARPRIEGTVAVGEFHTNESFYTGLVGTNLVDHFPLPVTRDLLRRGQERYDIYCAVCHGPGGDGDGMIVQRGFPRPPSYHIDRLRAAPIGHFYRVIAEGYGVMYPYATRVAPADRWKIAAYIRALQLSRHATLQQAPPKAQEELRESKP
jgi:cytochrome c553